MAKPRMFVDVGQGRAFVKWNDAAGPEYPVMVTIDGLTSQLQDEQSLRDLYDCLTFLYGSKRDAGT